MSVEYYRSDDPMENFVLGVVIQELVNETEDSNAAQKPKTIRLNLRWQQKVFSPSEIADYVRNKHNRSVGSPVDFENRLALTRQEKEGVDHRLSLEEEVLFYTLVDRDIRGREMMKESMFSRPEDLDDTDSSSSLKNDSFNTTHSSLYYQQQRHRHQKSLPTSRCRRMQLCFATDILLKPLLLQDTVGRSDTGTQLGRRHTSHLSSRDQGGIGGHTLALAAQQFDRFYEEHVLCEIAVYEDGVIQLNPALSKPVAEPLAATANLDITNVSDTPTVKNSTSNTSKNKNGQTDALAMSALLDTASLSLFLDDQTCENALRHGFLLGTRKIRAKHSGRAFQIAIFNQRAVWSPLLLEMRRNDSILRDSLRAASHRPYLPMISPPMISATAASTTSEITMKQEVFFLELVDLLSFDYDDMCLSYEILLPDNYTVYNTAADRIYNNNTNINNKNINNVRVVSQGYTHVAHVSPYNPVNFVTQSLVFVPLLLCVAVMSCVAVAVGVSWLLWVCPVLCIVIFHYIRPSRHPCITETRAACLNHCVSLKCVVMCDRETSSHCETGVVGEVRVSVYGKAMFDRGILIGVASFPLYVQGRASDCEEVPILSLQGGIETQLRHFFLGQSVSLKRNATHSFFNAISDKSRFGSLTSLAGKLRVRRLCLSFTNNINKNNNINNKYAKNSDASGSATPSMPSGSAVLSKTTLNNTTTLSGVFGSSGESGSAALKQWQQLRREQSQRNTNPSSSMKLTYSNNNNNNNQIGTNNTSVDNNLNNNNNNNNGEPLLGNVGSQRPSVRSILDSLGSANKRPSISNTITVTQNDTSTPRETPRLAQRSRANSSLTNNNSASSVGNFTPQQSPKVDTMKIVGSDVNTDNETVNNTIINSARRPSPRQPTTQNLNVADANSTIDNSNIVNKPVESEAKSTSESTTPSTRKRIPLRSRYNSFRNNSNNTNEVEEMVVVTGNLSGANSTITTNSDANDNNTANKSNNKSPRLQSQAKIATEEEEEELEITIVKK